MPTKDKSIIRFMESTPWAITEPHLDVLFTVVSNHIEGNTVYLKSGDSDHSDEIMSMCGDQAVISISGTITKKLYGLDAISGGTTTDDYARCIQQCLANPMVSGIILNIDSPGGTVTGTKELADFIFESRGIKPIVAFASGQMCSAAYWIGSAADAIVGFPTASIGSIGVITKHQDWSKAEENAGVKTTYIYAGKYKSAGNSSEALAGDNLAYLQASVDDYYTLFVDDVARNLGISVSEATKLADARTHIASKALELGLIHSVGNLTYATHVAKQRKMKKGDSKMAVEQAQFDALQAQLTAVLEASTKQGEMVASLSAALETAKAEKDAIVAATEKKEKLAEISGRLATCKVTDEKLTEALLTVDASTADLFIATITDFSTRLSAVAEGLADPTPEAHTKEADAPNTPTSIDAAVESILAEGKITDIDEAISAAQKLHPTLFKSN